MTACRVAQHLTKSRLWQREPWFSVCDRWEQSQVRGCRFRPQPSTSGTPVEGHVITACHVTTAFYSLSPLSLSSSRPSHPPLSLSLSSPLPPLLSFPLLHPSLSLFLSLSFPISPPCSWTASKSCFLRSQCNDSHLLFGLDHQGNFIQLTLFFSLSLLSFIKPNWSIQPLTCNGDFTFLNHNL